MFLFSFFWEGEGGQTEFHEKGQNAKISGSWGVQIYIFIFWFEIILFVSCLTSFVNVQFEADVGIPPPLMLFVQAHYH